MNKPDSIVRYRSESPILAEDKPWEAGIGIAEVDPDILDVS